MGTRGVFGVHVNGNSKLMYNHFDSYPSGLGVAVLRDIKRLVKEKGLNWLKERALAVQQIDENETPTDEQIALFAPYTDLEVSEQSVKDWYCLLRGLQGELAKVLEVGYMTDGNNFIHDSLFCEWGYVLNLDDNKLEVYKGFQHHPHKLGRYCDQVMQDQQHYSGGPYYPCALVMEFSLDQLPDDESFVKMIYKAVSPEEED